MGELRGNVFFYRFVDAFVVGLANFTLSRSLTLLTGIQSYRGYSFFSIQVSRLQGSRHDDFFAVRSGGSETLGLRKLRVSSITRNFIKDLIEVLLLMVQKSQPTTWDV